MPQCQCFWSQPSQNRMLQYRYCSPGANGNRPVMLYYLPQITQRRNFQRLSAEKVQTCEGPATRPVFWKSYQNRVSALIAMRAALRYVAERHHSASVMGGLLDSTTLSPALQHGQQHSTACHADGIIRDNSSAQSPTRVWWY